MHFNGGVPWTPNLDEWIDEDHTILFHRGYAGAPNCSPSRASVLTGRTGDRDCIYSPNICSGIAAWECSQTLPLSTKVFTVAEAAKKSKYEYQTLLIGKWHLGDFFAKSDLNLYGADNEYSNPSMHGFDHWHSTEGNAATATPNCGCPAFRVDDEIQRDKCVLGHYEERFYDDPWCKTYWFPNDTASIGVSNISYIVGEDFNGDIQDRRDTHYMMSILEQYLNDTLDLEKPMLILLWTHAPHMEYIATEQYRSGCANGTYCDLSRGELYLNESSSLDYFGAISSLDDQIGRLRQMLRDFDIANNTLLYFTSDNGPLPWLARSSAGGLRGHKNDLFEGGIRVPTIMEWPTGIPKGSFNISYPISTNDFLPTVMELLGVESDTPQWTLDGVSYLDVLLDPEGAGSEKRSSPMGWYYVPTGFAGMDNDMKFVCVGIIKSRVIYILNELLN